jgi:hypothetical protein
MGEAGNSVSGAERRRLEIALRGHNADRVLEKAEHVPDLDLADALQITRFLVEHDDPRADRAQGRLFGRIVLDRRLDLEGADQVHALVGDLPDPEAVAGLSRFVRM